ncbi:MAG: 50S ribosomal protein L4 [Clostridiales Family XIII bacterium]|jgi:large subunit ribosomal protein L4|nr:50S ribosomal protein L4 [Clostridiales Family XIII bacterium]
MAKINVLKMDGSQKEKMEIKDSVFNIKPNQFAIYEAVKNHLANKRQGTQSAKTRTEVRGGGRKPFRQKGTGNARQGSTRAPIHVGGGVSFAPKPRDYSYNIPKKLKKLALLSALSDKFQNEKIVVIDELKFENRKTKEMQKFINNLDIEKKALIITDNKDEAVIRTAKNIQNLSTSFTGEINTYDILNHKNLVLTKDAVKKLEEVYS